MPRSAIGMSSNHKTGAVIIMSDHRVAFITGGIGGLGSAISAELWRQGRRIIAGYHPSEQDQATAWLEARKAEGMDATIVSGDVADYAACQEMAQRIEAEVGPVDILINNAGITRDKMMHKMELDQWNAVITVNLNSVFNVTRQFVDGMRTRGWGRIVNISSVNGQKGQMGQTNYCAAKAGMHGFTKALAQELAFKGVTVNTVFPGYTATPMTEAMPEDVLDAIAKSIPMGRLARPEEIAYTVAFLTDDRAEYITGAGIAVNGGLYMV